MFLQAFEFEQRIQNPNLQVDSMLKTSFAKQKAFNRAAIGHVIQDFPNFFARDPFESFEIIRDPSRLK